MQLKKLFTAAAAAALASTLAWADGITITTTSLSTLIPNDPEEEPFWRDFSLQAEGGTEPYSWRLADGSELPGEDCWFNDSGEISGYFYTSYIDGTFTFDVIATDDNGEDSPATTITLTVAEDTNALPVIESVSPNAEYVHIDSGASASKTFSVSATDSDGDALTYSWSLYDENWNWQDGKDDDTTGSWQVGPLDDGTYHLEVSISDGQDYHDVRHSWTLVVGALEPLAVGRTAFEVLIPGDLEEDEYAYRSIELPITGGLPLYSCRFADDAQLPGEYSEIRVEQDGDGSNFAAIEFGLTSADVGAHEFDVVVTDGENTQETVTITLTVGVDPNSRPVIESFSPNAKGVRIDSGATPAFSVSATDADGDDLMYSWSLEDENGDYVDSKDDDTTGSWEISSLDDGTYHVEVYVSDGHDYHENRHSWTLVVGDVAPLTVMTTSFEASVATDEWTYFSKVLEASGGVEPYEWRLADNTYPTYIEDFSSYGRVWFDFYYEDVVIGENKFDVIVTDALGTENRATVTLTVAEDPNHRPVIDEKSQYPLAWWTTTIRVGDTPSFWVKAHDPDSGDELTTTWTVYGYKEVYDNENEEWYHPVVAVLKPQDDDYKSVLFPLDAEPGEYYVEAVVSDGEKSDDCRWYINVVAADAILIDQDLPHATEFQPYSVQLTATGGTEPYTWSLLNDGGEYSSDDGEITADGVLTIPTGFGYGMDPGDYTICRFWIRVENADGTATQQIYVVIDYNGNKRPRMVVNGQSPAYDWSNPIEIHVGETQTFSVVASDPEGAALSYEWWFEDENDDLIGGKLDCTTSAFTWTPVAADLCVRWLVVKYSDGEKASSALWEIKVLEAVPVVDPPVVVPPVDEPPAAALPIAAPPPAYTVKFDGNKGKGKMKALTYTYGAKVKYPQNKFTRKGYVFAGWATKKNGKVVYEAGLKNVEWTLTKDGKTQTLFAIWAKPNYTVKFYGWAKGVTGTMDDQPIKFGKSVKLRKNAFERKGYTFKGWATSKANAKKGKVAYKNKAKVKNLITTGKTVKLYAVWGAAKKSKKK